MLVALLVPLSRPAPAAAAAAGPEGPGAATPATVVSGAPAPADGCCPPAGGCAAGDCAGMAGCGVAPVLSPGSPTAGTDRPLAARPAPDDASLPPGPDPDRAVPPPRA